MVEIYVATFRHGPKDRTRNLEITRVCFARPGMTMVRAEGVMSYYVYILASRKDGTIYIGITNDFVRRVYEHPTKAVPGFTSKYNITRPVWFEICDDPISAISREKELKKWRRSWKVQLIEANNPQWDDVRIHLYLTASFRGVQSTNPESRDSGFGPPDRPGMTPRLTPSPP
jgi:putative endonuclease